MNKSGRAVLIVCVLLTLIALAVSTVIIIKYTRQPVKEESDKVIQNTVVTSDAKSLTDVQKALIDRRIYFSGLPAGPITKEQSIQLRNPKENDDIYIEYHVIYDGNEIFKSDLIPSGMYLDWTPGEVLGVGTFDVEFQQVPKYRVAYNNNEDDWVQLTSGSNSVTLEITE